MKQIEEKNLVLKSLSRTKSNEEKIKRVKTELDGLLYEYLKSMRVSCSSPLVC
jgi:hypothetical protein